jgi:hypothetical protein
MKRTFRLTKYYGFCVERMPDADGRPYASFVVWYRRAPKRLGYLYFAIPLGF